MMIVPENMFLPETMKQSALLKRMVYPIAIDIETRSVEEQLNQGMTLKDALTKESKTFGTVCYVVRRPGWVLCREEGLDLSRTLFAAHDVISQNFGLIGVVKEVGIDDQGLAEFYADYITHPLYHDESKVLYDALGGRTLQLTTWNPLRWITALREMSARQRAKGNLSGNMKGEGMVQGGVVIFDSRGNPRYAYQEDTGSELPIEDLLTAAMAVIKEDTSSQTQQLADL